MTAQERLQHLVTIASGLLASGHYTEQTEDGPELRKLDYGKDWKVDGFVRRFDFSVMVDSLEVLDDLEAECERIAADKECDEAEELSERKAGG